MQTFVAVRGQAFEEEGNMGSVQVDDNGLLKNEVHETSGGQGGDRELDTRDPREVRRLVWGLEMSAWGLSTLSCALEAGILDHLAAPQSLSKLSRQTGVPEDLVRGILDVLVALGLVRGVGDEFVCEPGMASWASGRAKEFLVASLRSNHFQSSDFIERGRRGTLSMQGWGYPDPELLEAQGTRSAQLVAWMQSLFPALDGLVERLESPSANFLDVGTGVAALAIEMCRHFPSLRIVGIDPFETALAQARKNIAEARLEGRIEIRAQRVQELADSSNFDLVHIPILFLSTEAVTLGLERVFRALRPGGWVFLQSLAAPGNELTPALSRLMCLLWGSEPVLPDQAGQMLAQAGYDHAQVLPAVLGVPMRAIAGQRPIS
jgi:2-hydroxy-4-(methylsulfanyl)butanoate S-methyltransferase